MLQEISRAIATRARGHARCLVAIVGPPGAGKSTVAAALAAQLDRAAVLPMDGFHLDNDTLDARGLLARKGAPQTFDTDGLRTTLDAVRAGGAVRVPTFDRAADRVVPEGGQIDADTAIVLVEGNYLLLDAPGWSDLHALWDFSVMLSVPFDTLEQRLVQRWLDHGMSPDAARTRAHDNDLKNARTVQERSIPPDLIFPSA